jgi:hypothetical protein
MSWLPSNLNISIGDTGRYNKNYNSQPSLINSLFFVLIAIIMILVSIYLLFIRKNTSKNIVGKVIKSDCNIITSTNNNGFKKITNNCNLEVEYTINNVKYTNTLIVNSKYNIGDSIKLSYNSENVTEIWLHTNNIIYIGGILMSMGCCFMSISILSIITFIQTPTITI